MDHAAAVASVKSASKDEGPADVPTPDVGQFIKKSALLNLGIAASALVMAATLGPSSGEFIATLVLMTILLVWVLTFLAAVLVISVANSRRLARLLRQQSRRRAALAGDLADAWLDGPA